MPAAGLLLVSSAFVLLFTAGAARAVVNALPLRDNVGVAAVSGGDGANPLWNAPVGNEEFRRTVVRALDSAGFLERARGEGRFALGVELESAEQSTVGFAATMRVRYTLTDRSCGEAVYQESIPSEYAPRMWDSLLTARVGRQLSEGAARLNIGILTEQLLRLSLFQEKVSLSQ